MTIIAAAVVLAIVTQDQAALRASPKDTAQQQAVLWQGDSLEIRGEKQDFLQVYDHRRERAGYIRASQVRKVSLAPADAPELLSVVRFLRDTPGAESLGIGYAAAYLKAAPAAAITAEPFDALGSMADRLARRASSKQGKATSRSPHTWKLWPTTASASAASSAKDACSCATTARHSAACWRCNRNRGNAQRRRWD